MKYTDTGIEYIIQKDNIERRYTVLIDAEKLKELLDEVVRKCSYRTHGKRHEASYSAEFDEEKKEFISGECLPNGDPMFENIEKIYRFTSNNHFSYHCDSIGVDGIKVTPPYLAFILAGILKGNQESIYHLEKYDRHEELISHSDKIELVKEAIESIDDYEVDKKIKGLEYLKKLLEAEKEKQYFDAKLLRVFYEQAKEIIKIKLINEMIHVKDDIVRSFANK
ncbi:MAG: hypothetical protein GX951_03450 [Mollicutes bacterium]|nr:hypothetical protein [Mollicutes bacterium]